MKKSMKLPVILGVLALMLALLVGCTKIGSFAETEADSTPVTEETESQASVAETEGEAKDTQATVTETEDGALVTDAEDVTADMSGDQTTDVTLESSEGGEAPLETADAETYAQTEEITEPVTEAPTEAVTEAETEPAMVVDMAIAGDGYDIFLVKQDQTFTYRYGCTYLYTADAIHAYFAGVGSGTNGDWDYITYQKSTDGGATWSKEKVVLAPTRGNTLHGQGNNTSNDYLSTCDPGVVFFGGYYYIGYTSTLNLSGTSNNIFVARSKNPDGPFEKWNGNGWGGSPEPIIYYDQDYAKFGIGEPSFVVLDDTLYIYHTNICPAGDYLMVATADATNENWPATIQHRGVGIKKETDSVDVKYVEDWGKFIGVATGDRFTANSWLAVYESDDGLNFRLVDAVRENTYAYLHNAGLSSRVNGHINIAKDADKLCVVYGYGYVNGDDGWGLWNTRVQPITLGQVSENGYAKRMIVEKAKKALDDPRTRAAAVPSANRSLVMVRPKKDIYEYALSQSGFTLEMNKVDEYMVENTLSRSSASGLTFTGYDTNIISIDNSTWKVTFKSVGCTPVVVNYQGLSYLFYINVTSGSAGSQVVGIVPVKDTYTIYTGDASLYRPQLRFRLVYANGAFEEFGVNDSDATITYSGYDTNLIKLVRGIVYAKTNGVKGETEVTVTYNGYSCKIKIVLTDDPAFGYFQSPSA